MPSTVLMITNEQDLHADAVVLELQKRDVPVFRFHPEDFPHACSISIEIHDGHIEGVIANEHHRVTFDDICAAWYRRPHSFFPSTINPLSTQLSDYVKSQSAATMRTLYACLQTLWVGHPHKLQRADVKALQLAEASKAGLTTPHTLISNQPEKVAAFVDRLGDTECAVKTLYCRGVSGEDGYRMPLTTVLPKGHSLDAVALAPSVFEPYVAKAAELRCVVIGRKIFAAKINSQANEKTRQDWRAGDCQYEVFSLPARVEAAIHRLMDSFEINFASLDMIVTPDGDFVFLELNPNGQWLWLELDLGLPLVASLADLLTTNYSCEMVFEEALTQTS